VVKNFQPKMILKRKIKKKRRKGRKMSLLLKISHKFLKKISLNHLSLI
jgi:hypothetical protein